MNTLFLLWSAVRSAYRVMGRSSDRQEQQAMEAYLGQSRSVADLERRERQMMRSSGLGTDVFSIPS